MVFSFQLSINGTEMPAFSPSPKEWQAVIAGRKEPIEIEALVQRVWP